MRPYLSAMIPVILVMALLAGCSSSDDDNSSGCSCSGKTTTEKNGLAITFEKQTVARPSNVSVLFKVATTEGVSVPDLTAGNFEIFEDDSLIDEMESCQAIQPKPGTFVHYPLLLLDLSGSVLQDAEKLSELRAAATAFVEAVMSENTGEIETAIWWFDGADKAHILSAFTTDTDALTARISGITASLSKDSSTNLYGAFIQGVDEVTRVMKNYSGVASGSLVVFTDGRDQAARATLANALSKVEKADSGISFYTIGLGENTDEPVLNSLGKNGFVAAADIDQLVPRFTEIADKIRADVNSHYLLEYCSPKRKGAHDLTIRAVYGTRSGSVTTCFCADGFEGGCSIAEDIQVAAVK